MEFDIKLRVMMDVDWKKLEVLSIGYDTKKTNLPIKPGRHYSHIPRDILRQRGKPDRSN